MLLLLACPLTSSSHRSFVVEAPTNRLQLSSARCTSTFHPWSSAVLRGWCIARDVSSMMTTHCCESDRRTRLRLLLVTVEVLALDLSLVQFPFYVPPRPKGLSKCFTSSQCPSSHPGALLDLTYGVGSWRAHHLHHNPRCSTDVAICMGGRLASSPRPSEACCTWLTI